MGRRSRKWIWLWGFVLAIAVLAAIFFKSRPMLSPENHPKILFMDIELEKGGKTSAYTISDDEIPDEMAHQLISIFTDIKIRNTLLPPPQVYEIAEGCTHITVRLMLENAKTSSMFVNLCSDPHYSSAQFGDTHYSIIHSQQVFDSVYRLLSDES